MTGVHRGRLKKPLQSRCVMGDGVSIVVVAGLLLRIGDVIIFYLCYDRATTACGLEVR